MLSTSPLRHVRSGTHAAFGDDRCRAQSVALMEQLLPVGPRRGSTKTSQGILLLSHELVIGYCTDMTTMMLSMCCCWFFSVVVVDDDDDSDGADDDAADDTNPRCW